MAEIKTKPTDASISKFIDTVNDETKRMDSYKIIEIMKELLGMYILRVHAK